MEGKFTILTVADLIKGSDTVSYNGEVVVTKLRDCLVFIEYLEKPIYVNAFAYFFVMSGTAMLNIDGTDYSLDGDKFVTLTPLHLGYFHDVSEDFDCVLALMTKKFVDEIPIYIVQNRIVNGIQRHSDPVMDITDRDRTVLLGCLDLLSRDISDFSHKFRFEKVRSSVIRFYLELDNVYDVERTELSLSRYGRILRSFMGLLMDNFRTQHLVSFYADALNLSPQHLTLVIKSQTGRTVRDFIDEMLYGEARNLLLDSSLSIQQIADALNFSDQSAFTKFFKRQSLTTPQLYRRK